jgi:excisionase family DNA binding protein
MERMREGHSVSERLWLTIREACAFLGCGRTKLYYLMNCGAVPWEPFGGQRRIRTDDLVELMRRGTRRRAA